MRKLGKGQSVVFCISEEIKTKILSVTGKYSECCIEVSDVLCWAVSETWADMQRSIPLWALQGERFERQSNLWRKFRHASQVRKSQAENFLEPESQTLEQRYRPRHKATPILVPESDENENIHRILDRCREFANLNFSSTQLQEEQERELAPEIEQERQVQRPPPSQPKKHHLHADVRSFVSTGVPNESSKAFQPAFEVLRKTSAAIHLDVSQFPPGLLATNDFAETVQMRKGQDTLDNYQRPVQWVLTSPGQFPPNPNIVKYMIIISPYEANELHSEVRRSKAVTMHLYAPRQNRSFSSLDKLTLYSGSMSSAAVDIPTTLRIQLNLFAGQLYISSYQEYREICDFLGVASVTTPEGLTVAADGFIVNNHRTKTKFTQSPLKFLKLFMSHIRKDGHEIDKTHLGKILDGKLLCMSDFQDCSNTSTAMRLSFRNVGSGASQY
jgi:hypothetical protein